ncbi:flagellar biosynthesis protein FlgJ [Zavarzinia compransoris]|uniref:Flagellar biosynthesis protein FlgJ n=2 Tax=Zavarzinia compransoris TaxID=1264899 RepID=A0A317DXB8_9PROT|nr:flagellar biosynthesis protein FlgJ [Zavarzinia compransoris]
MTATAQRRTYAGVPADILTGIQTASARTGMDFSYLLAQAKLESGYDAGAKAATSSARGLYQFIEQTWLKMVKDHGAEHGVGNLADAITKGADGRMKVADAATRKTILDLRHDPTLSALMGAEFASDNKAYLERRLTRPVNSTDLYMAHFLGAGGASRFLAALDRSPASSAAALLPEAAASNPNVFYDKAGKPRSVKDIYARFAGKLEAAGATASAVITAQAEATVDTAVAIGSQIGRGLASVAGSIGRAFGPGLSADTVLALAALPMPGEKAEGKPGS